MDRAPLDAYLDLLPQRHVDEWTRQKASAKARGYAAVEAEVAAWRAIGYDAVPVNGRPVKVIDLLSEEAKKGDLPGHPFRGNQYTDGQRSWDDFPWDEYSQEKPREKDIAPERTPEGDFVFYHGTSDEAAESIIREKNLRPDDIGAVGVGTRPEDVSVYGYIRGRKTGTVVRVVIAREGIEQYRAEHEGGGSGHNQFLLQPESGRIRGWTGVKLKDARVVRRRGEAVTKGDLPGHPFRGNQYTDGYAAGGEEEQKILDKNRDPYDSGRVRSGGYYSHKPGMPLAFVQRMWEQHGLKAYDPRGGDDDDGRMPVDDLWAHREYTWDARNHREGAVPMSDRVPGKGRKYGYMIGAAKGVPDAEPDAEAIARLAERGMPYIKGNRYEYMKAWMKEHGWKDDPAHVAFGRKGGFKVGEGNHRLAIARDLGMKDVPVRFHYQDSKVERHPQTGYGKFDRGGYVGEVMEKGDYEGHPFRGNQWTDGTGGGDVEALRGKKPTAAEQERNRKENDEAAFNRPPPKMDDLPREPGTKTIRISTAVPGLKESVSATCKKFGFDESMVTYTKERDNPDAQGPGGERGGLLFATYNNKTGEIRIHEMNLWILGISPAEIPGIVSHEITHAMADRAFDLMGKQQQSFERALKKNPKLDVMPSGKFPVETKRRWPEFVSFVEAGFELEKLVPALRKECPGVSQYSDAFWDHTRGKAVRSPEIGSAIHETLAEVGRRLAEGDTLAEITSSRPTLRRYYETLMEIGRKAAQKKGKLKKGDLPGHPFRGNQWTQGQGGQMAAEPGSPEAYIERRVSRIQASARTMAEKLGFDPDRVEVKAGSGPTMAGFDGHAEAAHYDHLNGKIVLWSASVDNDGLSNVGPGTIRSIMAHEVGHARYYEAWDALHAKGGMLDPNADYFTTGMKLRESDGVTAYSRAWWSRFEKEGGGDGPHSPWDRAINETLAEIHERVLFGEPLAKVAKPVWRKLYREVLRLSAKPRAQDEDGWSWTSGLKKGDFVGHPFRGNQWTDVAGTEALTLGEEREPTPKLPPADDARYTYTQQAVGDAHQILGRAGWAIGTLEDLPAGAGEEVAIKAVGVIHPLAVSASEGVAEAYAELARSENIKRGVLDILKVVVAQADPDIAMAAITGAGKAAILLNVLNASGTDKGSKFTVGAKAATKAREEGKSEEEATRAAYRIHAFHEVGHMVDSATGDRLTRTLEMEVGALPGPDMERMKWLEKHVSTYARANSKDALAEVFAMVMDGQRLPKELRYTEEYINAIVKARPGR